MQKSRIIVPPINASPAKPVTSLSPLVFPVSDTAQIREGQTSQDGDRRSLDPSAEDVAREVTGYPQQDPDGGEGGNQLIFSDGFVQQFHGGRPYLVSAEDIVFCHAGSTPRRSMTRLNAEITHAHTMTDPAAPRTATIPLLKATSTF